MVLIDTNVLFSFVVENKWSATARALFRKDDSWHTESHALVGLTNVLVCYVRNRLMTYAEARDALNSTEKLLAGRLPAKPTSLADMMKRRSH